LQVPHPILLLHPYQSEPYAFEFKEHWNHLDVSEKRNSFKEFNHPILGQLKFEMMMLQMNEPLGAKLVLFIPAPDSSTKQKIDKTR
jgi:hypothetical protein